MTTLFAVHGPLEVPYYKGKAGRTITDDNVRQFWSDNDDIADERGCYVFGIRAGKGFRPAYVGKATRSFRRESFQSHKLTRYQQFLANYRRGTPIIFFLVAPKKRGVPNVTHISDLEDFLIQTGLRANPDLLNIKGTKAEQWGIAGILRSGKGKRSNAASLFCALMKFK